MSKKVRIALAVAGALCLTTPGAAQTAPRNLAITLPVAFFPAGFFDNFLLSFREVERVINHIVLASGQLPRPDSP